MAIPIGSLNLICTKGETVLAFIALELQVVAGSK